jgi:4-hydroxybenzoate polyprenyltransferase
MSTFDLIRRYLVERARLGVFVPLALLLALTGRVFNAGGFGSLSDFLVAASQALILTLAFRIWDDLEDRGRDVHDHPNRVMVVSRRTAPFVMLMLLFAVVGTVPVVLASHAVARLVALDVAIGILLVWYGLRWRRSLFGGFVVLVKYPAIALTVAPAAPPPLALASLYLVVCVFETLDDRALRASITSFFGHRVP